MKDPVADFCQRAIIDIARRDGESLCSQLTVANKTFGQCQVQVLRGGTSAADPLFPDEESLSLFDELWAAVVSSYFEVMQAVRDGDKSLAFQRGDSLLKAMNRCAERENDWILPPLKTVVRDVKALAVAADIDQEVRGGDSGSSSRSTSRYYDQNRVEKEMCVEKISRTINRSFTICLNDRDLDFAHNKKKAVYFFIGQLYHIYFKLNNYDLARSVQRALSSKLSELPPLNKVPKASAVSYLYYSGCLHTNEGNLARGAEQLSQALSLLNKKHTAHQQSILLVLIPIRFLISNVFPSSAVFKQFPKIRALYEKIFKSIKQGNLKKFNGEIKKIEPFLLKKNLYLVFQQLRLLLITRLFKKTFLIAKLLPDLFTNVYQLPLSALAKALDFSSNHSSNVAKLEQRRREGIITMDADLSESYLANLIFEGYVKGYIAHGNGVVVLSKKDPFPKRGAV